MSDGYRPEWVVMRHVPRWALLKARLRGYKRHPWDYYCLDPDGDCLCCYDKIDRMEPGDIRYVDWKNARQDR